MVVTSRSSTMTITFRSDVSYVDQGFSAEFQSFVPTNRNSCFDLHPRSSSRSVSLTPSLLSLMGQLVLEASSVTTTCASTKRCGVTAGTTVGTTVMRTTAVSKNRQRVPQAAHQSQERVSSCLQSVTHPGSGVKMVNANHSSGSVTGSTTAVTTATRKTAVSEITHKLFRLFTAK